MFLSNEHQSHILNTGRGGWGSGCNKTRNRRRERPYSGIFLRICNFLRFTETIFADAVNVTPNRSSFSRAKVLRLEVDPQKLRKFCASKKWRYIYSSQTSTCVWAVSLVTSGEVMGGV